MATHAQPAAKADAPPPSQPRRLAVLSDDLALKILLAVATTVVLGRLGFDPTAALLGAALSPVFADLVKAAVERRGWRRRHFLLMTLVLFLVHLVGRALAALRRRQARPRRPHAAPVEPLARRALLATGAVASVVTVAAFTAAEVAHGGSLVAERRLTFFPASDPVPPDLVKPTLRLPASIVVDAPGPRRVWFTVSASDRRDGEVEPRCTHVSGARFPIGRTQVTCQAVDEAGNRATGAFIVTVRREERGTPIWIRFPERVPAEASGPDGAVVSFVVTAGREGGEALPPACTPPSRSRFRLGRTTVTCSATAGSDRASRTFPVIVVDTRPPRLALPDAVEAATAGVDRRVEYAASARDRVDGPIVPSCSPPSASVFPLGATTVRCTAVDSRGNQARSSFVVTVVRSDDTTPPRLALPEDRATEATSSAGAPVTYDVGADDDRDEHPSVTCTPPSGTTFPLGATEVRCAALDAAGNRDTGSFEILVSDTRPPKLSGPPEQIVEARTAAGAPVSYLVSARDAVDGSITPECSPPSGRVLPLGTTRVRCTASDKAGNRAEASFAVTVRDSTGPVFGAPLRTTAEATSAAGAVVRYRVTARDAVDGPVRTSCSLPAGSSFPLGETTVTCRATDRRNNLTEKVFTVTVRDTTGPTVTPPKDVRAEARSAAGARVRYVGAKAVDAVDGPRPVQCSPRSGSTFRLGETTVTCTATDRRGNAGQATFRVIVRDTTAPVLRLDDMTVYIDSGKGTVVTFPPAKDAVAGDVLPTCRPKSGSFFPVNVETTVQCFAVDPSGNASPTVTFTVTVHYNVE